ncbi:hypothetical protein DMH88_10080 [Escherichia coli]|nr:hypothetical protein [Escherichia coli]
MFEFDVVVSFFNNLRSSFHDFPLPFSTESGIFIHLQNQVPGLRTLKNLQATYDAPASFMSCARLYLNGGLGGAPQGAPVACNAGSSNPFSPPP